MPGTYANYIVIIKCIYKVCYNKMKIINVETMKVIDSREEKGVIQSVL